MPISKRVTFESDGCELAGILYSPANGVSVVDLPTLIVTGTTKTGPATGTTKDTEDCASKEIVTRNYAVELARNGFATFKLDYERCQELGAKCCPNGSEITAKTVSDIIGFLKTLRELDADKIGAVGIDEGSSPLIEAQLLDNSNLESLTLISANATATQIAETAGKTDIRTELAEAFRNDTTPKDSGPLTLITVTNEKVVAQPIAELAGSENFETLETIKIAAAAITQHVQIKL